MFFPLFFVEATNCRSDSRSSALDLLSPQLVVDRRLLLVLRPQSLQSSVLEDPQFSILGPQISRPFHAVRPVDQIRAGPVHYGMSRN